MYSSLILYRNSRQGFANILTRIVLILQLLNPDTKISAQNDLSRIKITKYSIEDGLSNNSVSGITQDKNGFIWISTYTGLDRFDGYSFKNYINWKSTETDPYLYSDICADKSGVPWACARSFFIYRYSETQDNFESYRLKNDLSGGLLNYYFDSRGNLWLSSGRGITFLKHGYEPENISRIVFGDPLYDKLLVRNIAEDKSGNIWLGSDIGLFRLSVKNDSIVKKTRFRFECENYSELPGNDIFTISIDENDQLWAGLARSGIRKIRNISELNDTSNTVLHPEIISRKNSKLSCDTIFRIISSGKGKIFIKTCKGIDILDIKSGSCRKLCTEGSHKFNDIEEGDVSRALFYSNDGVLWIGSVDGLYKITFTNPFQSINDFSPDPTGTQPFKTSQVLADSYDRLWIGTPGNGLHVGLPDGKGGYEFTRFFRKYTDKFTRESKIIIDENIYCLAETEDRKLWVSTSLFQQMKGRGNDIEFRYLCPEPIPLSIYKDQSAINQFISKKENLWVIYMEAGIKIYDTVNWNHRMFLLNRNERILNPYLTEIDGRRFLRTQLGLYEIGDELVLKDEVLTPAKIDTLLTYRERFIGYPRGNFIITRAAGGYYFWLPSVDKGLFRYFLSDNKDPAAKLLFSKAYNTDNGLSNNSIYDIIEDKKGYIWVSTQNGLNRIDPGTGLIQSFFTVDGLPDNRFNYGACSDKRGFLYFCNVNGVVKFHPDSLLSRQVNHNTLITSIKLFDKDIREYGELKLPGSPHIIKSLKLDYRQNFLSLEYAAINHIDNKHIRYQYKMDNLNPDWIDAGLRRMADYPDLNPGKYVFRVRSAGPDGIWSNNEIAVNITITPPFWRRLWFLGIILISGAMMIYYFVKQRERRLVKRNIWLEKEVKEKTEQAIRQRIEVDQMKSRFYTNISHEFRTPLTLITNSAREIEKQGTTKSILTDTILNSGSRLLKLVNELLTLSKIEAGKLELKASSGDLVSAVNSVFRNYLSEAERKNIRYSFNAVPDKIEGWFDQEFISKIMQNLISNALKFTAEGGDVIVNIQLSSDNDKKPVSIPMPYVRIEVRDTGKGISNDALPRIFERFYQADNSFTREYEGIGIGLSIVKELVKRHYGEISVESAQGEGSLFTVCIPVGKEHLSDDEILKGEHEVKHADETNKSHSNNHEQVHIPAYGIIEIEKPLILIAEDNEELLSYLSQKLSTEHRVITAQNGKDALEKATQMNPDLIVSDIMMPLVDGMELCTRLKSSISTCHIPVILLTAKADQESKLNGLKTGADDYLTKPFDLEELLVRIENLIRQRSILREKFFSSPLSDIPHLHGNPTDEEFLKELLHNIQERISDNSLSVDQLASSLNLGKRTLQRKIKALTGLSPVDFIRAVRIKYASSILISGKMTITEAAYATGFNSLSYFTRVFREVMGKTPSEFLER